MKIGIVGCAGRMGKMLVSAVLATEGVELAAGTEQPGNKNLGVDLGVLVGSQEIGVIVDYDTANLFATTDAVIDFTVPATALTHARLAKETETVLVIGTTGLNDQHMAALMDAGKSVAVVQAGNMSLGVNLLVGLVEQVAHALGKEYDVEILEMHHKHKIDAPSGTALMIGDAVAKGRGVAADAVSVMSRVGQTGARPEGSIGYATLRGGDVIGEHSVIFAGAGERIELSHKATDRALFAQGALRAALWAKEQNAGLYNMRDVLGV